MKWTNCLEINSCRLTFTNDNNSTCFIQAVCTQNNEILNMFSVHTKCSEHYFNAALYIFYPAKYVADKIEHSINCMNKMTLLTVTLPCFLPSSLNYSGMCLASDAQFSDFLDGMGPAQFVGRQTLATTSMGESTYSIYTKQLMLSHILM